MALYSYQAYSKEGKKITGSLDAPSESSVRDQLVRMGLYPIVINLAKEGVQLPWYKRIFAKKVTLKDKILFTKQLSVLLKSGVPLLQSLELLVDQFPGQFRSILIDIKDGIKEGRSFADGLSKYPKVFENIYIQLVRAGEASGKLEVILDRLTQYLERQAELRKKVTGALSYPLIQLGFIGVIVIGLMVFVVPTISETFEQAGTTLPTSTRFIMAVANFLTNYYLAIIGTIIGLYILFRYWKRTATGARLLDKIKLKIPIVKFFARTNAIVQFSQTLGMLIEAGVNLAESLDIVVRIIDNRILSDALRQARDKIIKEGRISDYLKQTNIFPPIAIYLINTGEQTGQLDFMLLTVAKNYETELIEYADSLTAKIQPIMLIVMAVTVGFIMIAIVTPMMNMSGLIAQ